jgi:signal transduction histidine kinase
MDNFEGGAPMMPKSVTQTTPMQPQSVPTLQSEEVVLSREAESPIVRKDEINGYVRTEESKIVADQLLSDSKKLGLAEKFKKLATGDYRKSDGKLSESPDLTIEMEDEFDQEHKIIDFQEYKNSKLAQAGQEVQTEAPVNHLSLESRKQEVVAYVAEQTAADPLMKQMLGEVAQEMIMQGEDIDPNSLQEEALKRYVTAKESSEPMTLEEKVISLEEKFAETLKENEELRNELKEFKVLIKQQSETMNTMALALLEMAKKLHEEKEDEEEKVSLLQLLIQLMALLLQELASTDNDGQNPSRVQHNESKKSQPVLELPRIKLKGSPQKELPKAA